MKNFPGRGRIALLVAAGAGAIVLSSSGLRGQAPNPADETVEGTKAAIQGSHEDPAAVVRGQALYRDHCGNCHGMTAKGTDKGADLIRSPLLIDDDSGNLLEPVMRDGEPDKGMPRSNLSDQQISDIVAWLHVQFYAADHRTTYAFLSVLTGDPKRGEEYFNGAGKCHTCHSETGDLAGIGAKYDPHALQQRWLYPRTGFARGRGAFTGESTDSRGATTVTVTLPNGQTSAGTLDRLDDFFVSLKDSQGVLHTFPRQSEENPKVVVNDPLKPHVEMLRRLSDQEVHDVTAYLASLK